MTNSPLNFTFVNVPNFIYSDTLTPLRGNGKKKSEIASFPGIKI